MGKVKKEDMRISQEEYDRIRKKDSNDFICRNCGAPIFFEEVCVRGILSKKEIIGINVEDEDVERLIGKQCHLRIWGTPCEHPTLSQNDWLFIAGYDGSDKIVDILEEE